MSAGHLLKSDHCIVHTGAQAPPALRSEQPRDAARGLRSPPIRISLWDRTESLAPRSRINLAREYTPIDYERVFVRHMGDIHADSLNDLIQSWLRVRREKETTSAVLAQEIINAAHAT